jgi:hypothetical protein
MSAAKITAAMRNTALGMLTMAAMVGVSMPARAQAPASTIEPQAIELLRRCSEYVSGLRHFSIETRNFREDILQSGHRVDSEWSGKVTVSRPNKLRGEREDALLHQIIYYDGSTVTLYNPGAGVYATEAAPGTIEEMFVFVGEELGIYVPTTDLLWQNVFPLLVKNVTLATVIGKEVIGGVRADHLLFSRPGVDYQVWIADSGPPLPVKYAVTDTSTPELLSVITLLNEWNTEPAVAVEFFTFKAPAGAKSIPFLNPDQER